jgi:hypothetical protein
LTVATNWVVCVGYSVSAGGVTTTEAAGTGETVTAAVPVFPSDVAVIVVVPGVTAVTAPTVDTVATAAFEVLQVIVRPARVAPDASRSSAARVPVCPTVRLSADGLTATDATGFGCEVGAVPASPPPQAAASNPRARLGRRRVRMVNPQKGWTPHRLTSTQSAR